MQRRLLHLSRTLQRHARHAASAYSCGSCDADSFQHTNSRTLPCHGTAPSDACWPYRRRPRSLQACRGRPGNAARAQPARARVGPERRPGKYISGESCRQRGCRAHTWTNRCPNLPSRGGMGLRKRLRQAELVRPRLGAGAPAAAAAPVWTRGSQSSTRKAANGAASHIPISHGQRSHTVGARESDQCLT